MSPMYYTASKCRKADITPNLMMSAVLGRQIPNRDEMIVNHNTQYFKNIVSYVEYIARTSFDTSNKDKYFSLGVNSNVAVQRK